MTAKVLGQEYDPACPIATLRQHPRNANEGDLGAIIQSIEANDFWGALVVQRSTSYVLVGNHRLMAAKDAGIDALPVLWVDVDDKQALRILTADNRTARLGLDNREMVVETLLELAMDPGGLEGTGYDGDDLQELMEELERVVKDANLAPAKSATPIELTISCGAGVDQEELAATLTTLDVRIAKATVPCETVEQRDRVAQRLTELGYSVRKSGG